MLGLIPIPNRVGGFMIPVDSSDSTNKIITVYAPSGCRVMCIECTIENDPALLAEGKITRTNEGYFINSDIPNLTILRPVEDTAPLSIIKGNEILYCDYTTTDSGVKFNVPKGFRINQTICEIHGENTVPEDENANYIIEY